MTNRVQELLGVEIPIVQAPMGYVARAQLASAVSNAGAMGIIETSSGRLDEVQVELEKMADLTDKPFGVNVAQLFVRAPGIVEHSAAGDADPRLVRLEILRGQKPHIVDRHQRRRRGARQQAGRLQMRLLPRSTAAADAQIEAIAEHRAPVVQQPLRAVDVGQRQTPCQLGLPSAQCDQSLRRVAVEPGTL